MMNQFSNAATAVVFEALAAEPDNFERVAKWVADAPAKAPEEVRSFMERYVEATTIVSAPVTKELLQAALRDVRWRELCNRVRDIANDN